MNNTDWKILIYLREERSINKVAKRLFMTQPSLTYRLSQMEKEIGCPLFIRTNKGVHFTDAGNRLFSFAEKADKKYGFFVSEETARLLPKGLRVFVWGHREDKESFAHNLFSGLLYFNRNPVDAIIGEGTDTAGLGLAIMNRLTKASGYHIVVEKR